MCDTAFGLNLESDKTLRLNFPNASVCLPFRLITIGIVAKITNLMFSGSAGVVSTI
ncbi:hypothetical protein [Candidatus Vallotia lariciata]|uniref:hypothetical protein n=1 Tax=Candidatus Vallotia laricis TaxID=2018052 RepID=UPI001D01AA53|nr:hypothetical protein [Candidatus Vallotia lariciata]